MIELYTGTPGSGKSYHACERIWWRLKTGKMVIANFPVKIPKRFRKARFEYCPNEQLSVQYLLQYNEEMHKPRKEHQTLVVIDEAGTVFNSREWNTKGRMDWLKFFALHRHFGFDFLMIAQQDSMIDKQIRGLVEFQGIHRSVMSGGVIGPFLWLVGGNFMVINMYYGNKCRLNTEFVRFHRRIAMIYDTYALFDESPAAGLLEANAGS